MSLLSWFSPKKKPESPHSELHSSGLSRLDSTKPLAAARMAGTAQPANRKNERMVRREQLYAVVREAMVRAGVLSSSYKFKVLSLDPRGRQFLVMVDLAHGAAGETNRLAEIEAMVAQSAKFRHDILVTAVYWRANEHVSVGVPPPRTQPEIARPRGEPGVASAPVPLSDEISRPAELRAAPPAEVVLPKPRTKVDPLQQDEVDAFRKVLAASVRGEAALAVIANQKATAAAAAGAATAAAAAAAAAAAGQQSYTLLTGFEDTELVEHTEGEPEAEQLSGTQYGELR